MPAITVCSMAPPVRRRGGEVGRATCGPLRAVQRWRMQSWPWRAHELGRSRAMEHGDWVEAVWEEREGYDIYLYYFFSILKTILYLYYFKSSI
jgi:hypothetical protein